MNLFRYLTKISSSLFYLVGSVFLFILILNQFHFFEMISRFIAALKPLWIGGLLACFLQPLISYKGQSGIKRIILIYAVFIGSIFLLILILAFVLINNLDSISSFVLNTLYSFSAFAEKYDIFGKIDFTNIQSVLLNSYGEVMPFVQRFIRFLTTFSLSVITSFFFSLESKTILNEFKKYVPAHKKIREFYDIFSTILRQYILSTFFDMLYIIVTTSILLSFFKTPYAILLSVFLAVMNLFPYVGALIGSAVLVIVHYYTVQTNTLPLIFAILINSQIESNLIHAWICNRTMKVHPLFLFTALLVNDFFFGIVGVILSPIVASIFQLLFTAYAQYLNRINAGGWEEIEEESLIS